MRAVSVRTAARPSLAYVAASGAGSMGSPTRSTTRERKRPLSS